MLLYVCVHVCFNSESQSFKLKHFMNLLGMVKWYGAERSKSTSTTLSSWWPWSRPNFQRSNSPLSMQSEQPMPCTFYWFRMMETWFMLRSWVHGWSMVDPWLDVDQGRRRIGLRGDGQGANWAKLCRRPPQGGVILGLSTTSRTNKHDFTNGGLLTSYLWEGLNPPECCWAMLSLGPEIRLLIWTLWGVVVKMGSLEAACESLVSLNSIQ